MSNGCFFPKIVHMSSAHHDNDIRILIKECASLAKNGYKVYYVVANGETRIEHDVHIVGVPTRAKNRFERMTAGARAVYTQAVGINAQLYHFHDPEFLPFAMKLKKMGKKVIFDSHEDYPGLIVEKKWLPRFLRRLTSVIYESYEKYCVKRFDAVVVVTDKILDRLIKVQKNSILVRNYSKLDDITVSNDDYFIRERIACYTGGLSPRRAGKELIESIENCDVRLLYAGRVSPPQFSEELKKMKGWEKVDELGIVNREGINKILGRSRLGLSIMLPSINHIECSPNKLYEYMAAGLPFITSNVPSFEEMVKKWDCGICVDASKPLEITAAIQYLLNNPERAYEMGCNGKRAVIENYNWNYEEKKLCDMYDVLMR